MSLGSKSGGGVLAVSVRLKRLICCSAIRFSRGKIGVEVGLGKEGAIARSPRHRNLMRSLLLCAFFMRCTVLCAVVLCAVLGTILAAPYAFPLRIKKVVTVLFSLLRYAAYPDSIQRETAKADPMGEGHLSLPGFLLFLPRVMGVTNIKRRSFTDGPKNSDCIHNCSVCFPDE